MNYFQTSCSVKDGNILFITAYLSAKPAEVKWASWKSSSFDSGIPFFFLSS